MTYSSRLTPAVILATLSILTPSSNGFSLPSSHRSTTRHSSSPFLIHSRITTNPRKYTIHTASTISTPPTAEKDSFIDTELRGAAMKLHTKSQAPREGQAPETKPATPYVPTLSDYLQFLLDSRHVYQMFESVINDETELDPAFTMVMAPFRDTGLERVGALDADIQYVTQKCQEEGIAMPLTVSGQYGEEYAVEIYRLAKEGDVPRFMCHYYNWYFAHTAGGRMIGKKMCDALLGGMTLEFYKWEDLKGSKERVKDSIETLVLSWTRDEKDACVAETEATFKYGGAVNKYLFH